MDRLSREDRLVLWSDDLWPQDIGAVAILDGAPLRGSDGQLDPGRVRDVIAGRLHLVPRFRQRLLEPAWGLGGPVWVDAEDFDLADHLRVTAVAPPGGDRQLLDRVAELRRPPLDRTRPLWEMWLLTGLADGRVGLFIRLHHVVADGLAGIASLAAFMDATADAATAPAPLWQPAPVPGARALLVDGLRRRAGALRDAVASLAHPGATLRHARGAWATARELLTEPPGPQTTLNRLVGDDRMLAVVRSRLDTVRQIAHAHDAKINDVLLAATAGGLEQLLRHREELTPDLSLPVYVPVSLRGEATAPAGGNLISQMVVRLPVGSGVSRDRLVAIAAETARRKETARPSLGSLFRSRLVSGLLLKRIARQRINVETADLPGPAVPLYLAGAEILEIFPLLNLIGNVTLGVGALSYNGQFDVMVTADGATYPDLDRVVAGIEDALDRLDRTTRVPAGR